MAEVRVTCLRQHPSGRYWTARVTPADGPTYDVSNRFGSWSTIPTADDPERALPVAWAAQLQTRLRSAERQLQADTAEVAG